MILGSVPRCGSSPQARATRSCGPSSTASSKSWTSPSTTSHENGRATEEDHPAAFARARAVAAVAWALHPDPTLAASEAAYEAHCAFRDGSTVVTSVVSLLDDVGC
jgi:hypothetical protein